MDGDGMREWTDGWMMDDGRRMRRIPGIPGIEGSTSDQDVQGSFSVVCRGVGVV